MHLCIVRDRRRSTLWPKENCPTKLQTFIYFANFLPITVAVERVWNSVKANLEFLRIPQKLTAFRFRADFALCRKCAWERLVLEKETSSEKQYKTCYQKPIFFVLHLKYLNYSQLLFVPLAARQKYFYLLLHERLPVYLETSVVIQFSCQSYMQLNLSNVSLDAVWAQWISGWIQMSSAFKATYQMDEWSAIDCKALSYDFAAFEKGAMLHWSCSGFRSNETFASPLPP